MKLIALGDTHGTPYWKDILSIENPDKVVFIGDYFDGYDDRDEVGNFLEIVEYKEKTNAEVVLLLGNHDHHYLPEVGNSGVSRYQYKKAKMLEGLMEKYKHYFTMAHREEDILFTHAGVTKTFMNQTFGDGNWNTNNLVELINQAFRKDPNIFAFNGFDFSGDDITQTPIWVRPYSLLIDAVPDFTQVVGHTIVENIVKEDNIYFIDTMQTSHQYLVFEDGNVVVKQLVETINN